MKKILIFKLNKIAYDSTEVFADVLGKHLGTLGAKVEFFDASEHSIDDLEKLSGEKFDAVIDFNSKLPDYVNEDGSCFLNEIDAPFFNYILDHPIYHHAHLRRNVNNYNVICVDEDHCSYIKRYYPDIKKTFMIPLGAISYKQIDYINGINCKMGECQEDCRGLENDRKYAVVFPASYLNPDDYYEIINNMPYDYKKDVFEISDILINNPEINYEEAVKCVKGNILPDAEDSSVLMQMYFLSDIYARACIRKKVIEAVVSSKVPVLLFGENFENSGMGEFKNVTIGKQLSYGDSIRIMRQSQYILNVMPLFKAGIHDRVVNAMINGAVSITDANPFMRDNFEKNKDYIEFSTIENDKIPYIINDIYKDKERTSAIAQAAGKKIKEYTFRQVAKKVLSII